MNEICLAGISAIFGAFIKHLFDAWAKSKERPKLISEAFQRPDGTLSWRLRHVRGPSVLALRVYVRTQPGAVVGWFFCVDQQVVCKRLKQVDTNPDNLEFEWEYMNKGDVIDLELRLSANANAKLIDVEVDAKGLHEVVKKELRVICAAPRCCPAA